MPHKTVKHLNRESASTDTKRIEPWQGKKKENRNHKGTQLKQQNTLSLKLYQICHNRNLHIFLILGSKKNYEKGL